MHNNVIQFLFVISGVKIYPGKRSCTIDHLDYIMKHYGDNRNFLNVTGKLVKPVRPLKEKKQRGVLYGL